ncbi:MAG: CDP-alcohol phosphatidyltransferase family protein [Salinirussus sp.]
MTLDRLRPVAERALRPFVAGAVRIGLTPNAISVIALGLAVAAAMAFAVGRPAWYLIGAVLVFANGWLDILDGAVARELSRSSRAGDLVDHVLDRYADVALVAGLAAGIDAWALGLAAVTGVLLTSYLGTQAEAVGLDRVYGGLLGRADRLALIGIAAAVGGLSDVAVAGFGPIWWLLVLLATVGHLTAVQRFIAAFRALS